MAPLVLINNVYSHRNPGDSAIVQALGRYVQQAAPGSEVVFLSQFWQENAAHYERLGFGSAPPLWDIPMDGNKARRLARSLGSFAALSRALAAGPRQPARPGTLALYRRAALIMDAGGGSLFSSNRYPFYLGLYQHLFNLLAGARLGRPVVAAPQSVGPLHRRHDLRAVQAVLRQLDVVMVREPLSAALLRQLEVPHELVPDAAFLGNFIDAPSPAVDRILERRVAGGLNVGVTVLDWRWAATTRAAPAQEAYLRKIVLALARLARRPGAAPLRVHVFPHVTAGHGDSDSVASERLHHLLHLARVEAVLHPLDCSLSDRCQIYGGMDLFIGSRMHSCIFAMLRGVPTVGLAYQPKTIGTFGWLGLDRFALPAGSFSPDQLYLLLHEAARQPRATLAQFEDAVARAQRHLRQGLDRLIRPYLRATS